VNFRRWITALAVLTLFLGLASASATTPLTTKVLFPQATNVAGFDTSVDITTSPPCLGANVALANQNVVMTSIQQTALANNVDTSGVLNIALATGTAGNTSSAIAAVLTTATATTTTNGAPAITSAAAVTEFNASSGAPPGDEQVVIVFIPAAWTNRAPGI
jgi:hypothetical protein